MEQVTRLPGLTSILQLKSGGGRLMPEVFAPIMKTAVLSVSATHVLSSTSADAKGIRVTGRINHSH
jgi:hypothetical protein